MGYFGQDIDIASRIEYAREWCGVIAGKGQVLDFRAIYEAGGETSCRVHKLRGTIDEVFDTLNELNRNGYGIFATVNETDGEGVRASNIVSGRAYWVDVDHKDVIWPVHPEILVDTKNGYHGYWTAHIDDLDHLEAMNKRIAMAIGGDLNACDRARVLRVPGFYHRKDGWYLVSADYGCPVSAEIMEATFGVPETKQDAPQSTFDDIELSDCPERIKRAERLAEAAEPAYSGQGGHAALWKVTLGIVRGLCLSEEAAVNVLMRIYNPRCEPEWSEREILHKVRQAIDRGEQPWGYMLEDVETEVERCRIEIGNIKVVSPIYGEKLSELGLAELRKRLEANVCSSKGPLIQLNSALGGGAPAMAVTLIGAPPGQGKSSLALKWAMDHAKTAPALFVSLELTLFDLLCRACTIMNSGISWIDVRQGRHRHKFELSNKVLAGRNFYVATREMGSSPQLIKRMADEVSQKHGIAPLVVIDYMQMLARGSDDAFAATAEASESIRDVAQESLANVLCITSLNRASYSFIPQGKMEPDYDAVLRSSKNAGQLEYDAEVVMGIALFPKAEDSDYRYGWVCIAKNRSGGATCNVPIMYEGVSGNFFDCSEDDVISSQAEVKKETRDAKDAADFQYMLDLVRKYNPKTQEEIRELSSWGMARVSKIVARLVKSGKLVKGQNGTYEVQGGRSYGMERD